MEFELCSLHLATSNSPNLCIYVLYYVLYYISSLCSGGFAEATSGMCWFGVWWTLMFRGRDVHGWVRQLDVSPSTRRWSVEVYVSQAPHQGATVVFGYIEGSFLVSRTGDATNVMLLIYIGAYTHKYIGHEIANWWGWGGRRSEHCRRSG